MQARLAVLGSGGVKPVSEEQRERVEAEHRKWATKALARRKMWKEAEDTLLEVMTREELYVRWVPLLLQISPTSSGAMQS